jgi:hypothetical protein
VRRAFDETDAELLRNHAGRVGEHGVLPEHELPLAGLGEAADVVRRDDVPHRW